MASLMKSSNVIQGLFGLTAMMSGATVKAPIDTKSVSKTSGFLPLAISHSRKHTSLIELVVMV